MAHCAEGSSFPADAAPPPQYNCPGRPRALLLLLALTAQPAHAAEPSPTPGWPPWDGQANWRNGGP